MGAIEDRDPPEPRSMRMDAPEKVVVALFRRRLLEPHDSPADPLHSSRASSPILAGGVDPLQHDQQAVAAARIELALQTG